MPVDFIVGAAIGVAAASPRVRQAVRKGLIYGVGGVLVAYDKVAAVASDARQSVRSAAKSPSNETAAQPAAPAPTPAPTASAETNIPAGTPS